MAGKPAFDQLRGKEGKHTSELVLGRAFRQWQMLTCPLALGLLRNSLSFRIRITCKSVLVLLPYLALVLEHGVCLMITFL